MTNGQATTKFKVISAANLPVTDRNSLIDPYVIATFSTGTSVRTKCLKNNDAPVWNESFPVTLPRRSTPPGPGQSPSGFSGTVNIVLFDQNTFKDSQVLKATLDLSTLPPSALSEPFTIPLEPIKEKYRPIKGTASLTLCFEGSGADTYDSITSRLCGVPNVILESKTKTVIFPIAGSKGLVYASLKYERRNIFDVTLYVVEPNLALFLDIAINAPRRSMDALVASALASNDSSTSPNLAARTLRKYESKKDRAVKFHRSTSTEGFPLFGDVKAFEVYKANDVPAGTDFASIRLIAYRCEQQMQISADKVALAHGWKGALSFLTAAEHLQDVVVDRKTEEIYMEIVPGQSMLLVDYDESNVDIKVAILDTPENAKLGYEMYIKRQICERTMACYNPPLSRMDGRIQIAKIIQLDDVDYGTSLSDIRIRSFRLNVPLVNCSLHEAIENVITGKA
mmetsp:Transcript_20774/g.37173  ORF Transcript_20774/g.37173 Transcript_20774/m.37173 type:complete len:453 (-) Transcript_20774:1823-3181(-)